MRLHNLKPRPGAKRKIKRLGAGESSGTGKTCGRGHKGQKARSGASIRAGFEGGQLPLFRRLPRRGFSNASFHTTYAPVNLDTLEKTFNDGDTVNEETLRQHRLITGTWCGVKILGRGEIKKKLTVTVNAASKSAFEKIEKAGGKITLVKSTPAPAAKEETTKKSAKKTKTA